MKVAKWNRREHFRGHDLVVSKNACAEFANGLKIYDKHVAEFTLKHMRLKDMFNLSKVVQAGLASFTILASETEGARRTQKANFKYRFQ